MPHVQFWIGFGKLPLQCAPIPYSQGNGQSSIESGKFVTIQELMANCYNHEEGKCTAVHLRPLSVVANSKGYC